MSAILGGLETDRQPPMAIPLGHFLVGLGFLLSGGLLGTAMAVDHLPAGAETAGATATAAHVHLLLVGWICLTIMGAMTQFVPVWSGVDLHSKRLAALQLPLVAVGLCGFALGLVTGALAWLPPFAILMLAGFWTFVYNVGRTLWTAGGSGGWDVTERHFALALGFFLLVTSFGVALALDFTRPVFVDLPVGRSAAIGSHVTLAVFGAVLTTVLGALYQLATMFTQTEFRGVDHHVARFEELGYPLGVVLLAGGRLFEAALPARVGAVLVVASLVGFGIVLARRLLESSVEPTPMLRRYGVVAACLIAWGILTVPTWLADPLAVDAHYGGPGAVTLLGFGVVGFVVLGTLYHVIPFIVWLHHYSDRVGYEPVQMIDDLYDDRVARIDFGLLVAGLVALLAGELFALPASVGGVGGLLVLAGTVLFTANLLQVVRVHSPYTVGGLLVAALRPVSGSDG